MTGVASSARFRHLVQGETYRSIRRGAYLDGLCTSAPAVGVASSSSRFHPLNQRVRLIEWIVERKDYLDGL